MALFIIMKNDVLTDRKFWQEFWDVKDYKWQNESSNFIPDWDGMVCKDLSLMRNKKCIEIGCFPGRYMHYFSESYSMNVKGIDFVKPDFEFPFHVYKEDFLSFNPEVKYDLVCSFGFVEHFEDLAGVMKKHLDILDANGVVLITLPNMVHGWRYKLRSVFDRQMFVTHNKQAMIMRNIRSAISTLHCSETKVCFVKFSDRGFSSKKGLKKIFLQLLARGLRLFPLIDNALASEILILLKKC